MSSFELLHPERDQLLGYLDGELTTHQARRVQRHLKACWECRAEFDELRRAVGECVRYRKEVLKEAVPPPLAPWRDLTREFAQIDESLERRSRFGRPVVRWAVLAATAASLLAATLTLRTALFRTAAPPPDPKAEPSKLPASPASTVTRTGGVEPPVGVVRPSVRDRGGPPGKEVLAAGDTSEELRAVAALHQLGADLGEPVEVARDGSNVVVGGTGVSPILQTRIRDALVSLPHVVVRFSEAPAAAAAPESPPATYAGAESPSESAIRNQLEAKLGGHAEFESFASRLLDRNEAAMTRVYALRRLAQEFPPDVEDQLKAEERILLRSLASEHVRILLQEVTAIDGLASPALRSLGGSAAAASGPSADKTKTPGDQTWQAAAEATLSAARQTDTLLAALLGAALPNAVGPAQPAQNFARQLSSALAQLQGNVQQCDLLLKQ
jgi:hypothetical protein